MIHQKLDADVVAPRRVNGAILDGPFGILDFRETQDEGTAQGRADVCWRVFGVCEEGVAWCVVV